MAIANVELPSPTSVPRIMYTRSTRDAWAQHAPRQWGREGVTLCDYSTNVS